MEFYETTYILHPALQEGRLNDTIKVIEKKVQSFGAEILHSENWGRKKLSYLIDKEKYGTYVKIQFSGKNDCAQKLGTELEHNSNILSHLTISIKENDLVKQENDLDTQIAGHSRDLKKINIGDTRNTLKSPSENLSPSNDNVQSSDSKANHIEDSASTDVNAQVEGEIDGDKEALDQNKINSEEITEASEGK